MLLNYSPLQKREGDWAELIFAKTSGIVIGFFPVLSNSPRRLCES